MVKYTAGEFQKMLRVNDTCLIAHLILESATPEVIESYEREKELEIVLTINGIEVDIIPFLKLFEDQYDQQTALSAKKLYMERAEKILAPFHEAADKFVQLCDHMDDEIKDAVKDATDVLWLFDDEEESKKEEGVSCPRCKEPLPPKDVDGYPLCPVCNWPDEPDEEGTHLWPPADPVDEPEQEPEKEGE